MRFLLAAAALLVAAAPAAAQLKPDALQELRSDHVYVDPSAEMPLTPAEQRDLEDRIRLADRPLYVAVLPASAAPAGTILRRMQRQIGQPATYAVVAGTSFRAASDAFAEGVVPQLATEAFERRQDEGVAAVLRDFVSAVVREEERSAGAAAPARNGTDDGQPWGAYALAAAGAAGVGFYVLRRRRRQAEELSAARELAEEDLVALADDVQTLEQEVAGNDAAGDRYHAALDRYSQASARFDRVRSPQEVSEVSALVDDGRYEMASARAILEGRELPERRAPCFFDPRHGPSTRDVIWAPPYGGERPVPACEACALRVEDGGEPAAREVAVGGRRVPYWESAAAAPWAAGYFGFSLLPTLMLGSALGAGIGLGMPADAHGGSWDGDDFGGGDFGGGDFGGGDFGGGDFGGGGDF